MTKLPRVTAADLERALRHDGWYPVRQKGSHRVFAHPKKPGSVSVPIHPGKDIGTGLLGKILKEAGLSADDLRRLS